MGFNTVAVLFNDFTHELERDGGYSKRIAEAMRNVGHNREGLSGWFGAGKCISQAHADYTQIVAVGGNTGKHIRDANDLDWMALDQMADCLRRHGWRVRPPGKRKKVSSPRGAGE
jgi:hypothetical protein